MYNIQKRVEKVKQLKPNFNFGNILEIGYYENFNNNSDILYEYYFLNPSLLFLLDKDKISYEDIQNAKPSLPPRHNFYDSLSKMKKEIDIEKIKIEKNTIEDFTTNYKFNFIHCSNVIHFINEKNIDNVLIKLSSILENNGILFLRYKMTNIIDNIDYHLHNPEIVKNHFNELYNETDTLFHPTLKKEEKYIDLYLIKI